MTALSTPPASSPLPSLKINHAAIRVPDFDAAIAWYADKLDFRSKQTVSVAGLSFGFLYPAGDDGFHFEVPTARPHRFLHEAARRVPLVLPQAPALSTWALQSAQIGSARCCRFQPGASPGLAEISLLHLGREQEGADIDSRHK
jgi:catechol 2,3-dioxygenase-like lactoylglutathione lyase family enzyme